MPIELYPNIAKVKRNGVYQNLPGFVQASSDADIKAMIATSETSTTAQYSHAKNSYFILNDILYQADDDIAVNDIIAVGTNCHVEILGNDVAELINSVYSLNNKFTGGGFNPNGNLIFSEEIVDHFWVNYLTGRYVYTQYNYCSSAYIEIEPNANYTWLYGNAPFSYGFYDENKNLVGTSFGRTVGTHYVTAPATAKYLIYSWNKTKANLSDPVMIKGTTEVTEYQEPSYLPVHIAGSDYATIGYVDERTAPNTVTLELPDRYELVVGDTFELFWKGVINAVEYQNYFVDVVCDIGKSYKRQFSFKPSAGDIGTHVMTVTLYNGNHNKIDETTVNLIVKAKATSPATKKVVLYVTDSLGNSGYVPDEFHRRLTGTGGTPVGDELSNIVFIGVNESITNQVKYVGNGGWSWVNYNASMSSNKYMWITANANGKDDSDQHSIYKDSNNTEWKLETIETNRIKIIRQTGSTALPSTGTLIWVSGGANHEDIVYTASEQAAGNPFWSESQNKISFEEFVESQDESSLDYVYVLLGWNSTGALEYDIKTNVRTFLDNVLRDYPNCKIVILGLEIPSEDGLAFNYGQTQNVLSSYQKSMQFVFDLNKWYKEVSEEDDYINNVSFVNIAGQFDTEYNMQYSQHYVNVRNNTTEILQTNGVHPAQPGYYQISDACYRDFVHKLQEA